MFYIEDHEMNMNDKISEVEKFWLDKDEEIVGVDVGEPYFEACVIGVDDKKHWFDPIQSIEKLSDGSIKIDNYYNDHILQMDEIKRMVINLIYPITIINKIDTTYTWEYDDYHEFEYMVLIGG